MKRLILLPLILLLTALFFASTSHAQVAADFAAGAGFMFQGDEDVAFDARSLYGAVHWNGLKLPGPHVSTGLGIEFHPATVAVDGQTLTVDYRVWSLNRLDCPSALYCGTDLKIGQGGEGGWVADFDQRIVTGIRVARTKSAVVNFEMYFLEDDRPISALILVRWGGDNQPKE